MIYISDLTKRILMAAPCQFGVEGLVAGELRRMGAENVAAENGRVLFEGGEDILVRANLSSRYSERICIVMGRFKAATFDELFEGTKALPWERWIGKADSFPVKGSSLSSKLHSVPDCQKIIKKAVVDRLSQKYSLGWFEETGALHRINFIIMKDVVLLMLDTSGASLHKRGYRRNGAAALLTCDCPMLRFGNDTHRVGAQGAECCAGTAQVVCIGGMAHYPIGNMAE